MPYITNPVHRRRHHQHAAALTGLGRVGEALELAKESLALSRTWGAPRLVGSALSHLGPIAGARCARKLSASGVQVPAVTLLRTADLPKGSSA